MKVTRSVELCLAEAQDIAPDEVQELLGVAARTIGRSTRTRVVAFDLTPRDKGMLADGGQLRLWLVEGGPLAMLHAEVRP